MVDCLLKAQNKRIICEAIKTPEKIGHIFIPEEKLTQEAIVLDVADDFEYDVKVGDRILYEKFGGVAVPFAGRDYLFLNEKEILCVLEGA